MSLTRAVLCLIVLFGSLTIAQAYECSGRVSYFQKPFSNKCMECRELQGKNTGHQNCTFQNTDHCCENSLCNENNPNFLNWVNGQCKIPE
jgi:hypothetical protein